MPTMNSPSDSFLHSPFCFLSSFVASVLIFLPLVSGLTLLLRSLTAGNRYVLFWLWLPIYGRPGFWGAGKTVAAGSDARAGPTDKCPE